MTDPQRELLWLHRNLVFSKRVAVFGATRKRRAQILDEWLSQVGSPRTVHFEFKNLTNPAQILGGDENTSMESALSTAENRWNTGLVIVWEGLHTLAPRLLGILFHFLSSSNSNALHILCSDRNLIGADVPALVLDPTAKTTSTASVLATPDSKNDSFNLSLSSLDSLPRSDLLQIVARFEKTPHSSPRDVLMLSRARFLSGQRQRALEGLLQFIMGSTSNAYLQSPEGQELFVEALRQSNRAARYSDSRALADQLPKNIRISEGVRPFLNLELALAEVQLSGSGNTALLDSLIERLQGSDNHRALAEAIFHRARIFDSKRDSNRALFDYQRSGKLFRELSLHYQACTAFLNSAWILANEMKWSELSPILTETLGICSRFGYPHILASLETIQSQILRLQGRPQESLAKIDIAITRLESSDAPTLLLTDTIIERSRILMMLGNRTRAMQAIDQYLATLDSSDQRSFARIRELQSEFASFNQGAAAWLENQSRAADLEAIDEATLLIAAEHALLDPNSPESLRLERFPLGKIALQEASLLRTLAEEGPQSNAAIQESFELIRSSESLPECRLLRALAQCVRAQLTMKTDPAESAICLSKARDLLLSSGAEESAVIALGLWIEAIDNDALEELSTDSRWQKACPLDRERCENWIFRITPSLHEVKSSVEFFSILEGRLEKAPTPQELERFQSSALFIDDQKNLVMHRGKNLRSLNRKGVLYDFMKALMQSAPKGLEKEELSALVWGEDYNPSLHDPRIYVATRRLRTIFKDPRLIVQHRGRYMINPERSGLLIREKRGRSQSLTSNEKKILLTLQSRCRSAKTRTSITRGDLQRILGLPEATLKRGLKSLLQKKEINAAGAGRSRTYTL